MKIVITGRDFSTYDTKAVDMLRAAGHEVIDYSTKQYGTGTSEEEIIEATKDAEIIIAGLEPYSAKVIGACTKLKMISRRGIGYDSVDVNYCKEHGITVARTVGAVEGAVAELVMSYILYFSRRVDLQNESMQENLWKRLMMPGAKTRTLGLVGFGGIGKEIAKRAVPFGMKVLYNCRHPKEEWEQEYGVSYCALDELLAQSDYVSVNVPLTEGTKDLFCIETIQKMKKGSYLINIARGPIVNELALRDAVLTHHLAGAAVDVFTKEPCTDSALVGLENVILTPHTASYTEENFTEMNRIAAENALDFMKHELKEIHRLV